MIKLDQDWSLSCTTTITCGILVNDNNTILSVLHHSLFLSTFKCNSTLFSQQRILSSHKPQPQFKTHFKSISRAAKFTVACTCHFPHHAFFSDAICLFFSLCNFAPLFASCAYYDKPAAYLFRHYTRRQMNRWCLCFFFFHPPIFFFFFFYNRLPKERHQRE